MASQKARARLEHLEGELGTVLALPAHDVDAGQRRLHELDVRHVDELDGPLARAGDADDRRAREGRPARRRGALLQPLDRPGEPLADTGFRR